MSQSILLKVRDFIIGSLFPVVCLNCGADDVFVCSDCFEKIRLRNFNESWEKLGCDNFLDRVFIAAWYEDKIIKQMILRSKYQGQKKFFDFLGKLLIKFAKSIDLFSYIGTDAVILPLPLHVRRQRERGYNQSSLLAKELSDYFKIPSDAGLVRRKKYTRHQTGLSADKRRANLKNSFAVNKRIKILPAKVLIIDDVVTTGTSLNEIARVLKAAGVLKVYALVVAKN